MIQGCGKWDQGIGTMATSSVFMLRMHTASCLGTSHRVSSAKVIHIQLVALIQVFHDILESYDIS